MEGAVKCPETEIPKRWSYALAIFSLALVSLTGCGEGFRWPWQEMTAVKIELNGIARSGKEPMVLLNDQLEPMAAPAYVHKTRDLYDCEGMVAPWFQALLAGEFNHLAKHDKLQSINDYVCLMIVDKDLGPKEGRFSVHFYARNIFSTACPMMVSG